MSTRMISLEDLNERSREIFRMVVDAYVASGDPVGSRTLSRSGELDLSPASIRNTLADLEDLGLLYAPHTSAGRLPTELGLRLFVDGLMQIGELNPGEAQNIEQHLDAQGRSLQQTLTQATETLSGLSRCASIVMAPKADSAIRHIEFVSLAPGRALVVLVNDVGVVENRILEVPPGLPPAALTAASNFVNATLSGRTVAEAKLLIQQELEARQAELDLAVAELVEAGVAVWSQDVGMGPQLIVRGQGNLLTELGRQGDLERVQELFDLLDQRRKAIDLLELTDGAEGVRIFIGAENKLFDMAGCSLVVAPYTDSRARVVGALGVIGPTRLDYARVVPMVDYTARLIGRLLG